MEGKCMIEAGQLMHYKTVKSSNSQECAALIKEHIFSHGCQSAIDCVQILILQIKSISRVTIQVGGGRVHNAEFL